VDQQLFPTPVLTGSGSTGLWSVKSTSQPQMNEAPRELAAILTLFITVFPITLELCGTA